MGLTLVVAQVQFLKAKFATWGFSFWSERGPNLPSFNKFDTQKRKQSALLANSFGMGTVIPGIRRSMIPGAGPDPGSARRWIASDLNHDPGSAAGALHQCAQFVSLFLSSLHAAHMC